MTLLLPEGLHARPPVLEDAGLVTALFKMIDGDGTHITIDFTLRMWTSPEMDLAQDARIIYTTDNQIVAFLALFHRDPLHMHIVLRVHPDYVSMPLHSALVAYAEGRAQQLLPDVEGDGRVSLMTRFDNSDDTYRQALEQAGFVCVRGDYRMEIELRETPPEPVWPDGIELRPFTLSLARAAHEAHEEAFSDHWGQMPMSFEDFEQRSLQTPTFDPTLWFVPFDGEEIAGLVTCKSLPEMSWIDSVAVRRRWRRKGLALALVYHAFGEFYRRGEYKVSLYVDAQSLTGATRLYERVGMYVARHSLRYEKEVRAGRELSVQSLDA